MTIHFDCTQCGRCCHDLRLPLSVDEAIGWAHDGNMVELLCEATPWPEAPEPHDLARNHKQSRTSEARCGALPVRIDIILVAAFKGACPHLQADMRCGNYARRPRTCRIYPAEANPTVELMPAQKACPPEAWAADQPLFFDSGHVVPRDIRMLVEAHQATARQDAWPKAAACEELGISTAALANEGIAVFSPPPAQLVDILEKVRADNRQPASDQQWTIVTNRRTTYELLDGVGAPARMVRSGESFIAYFADEPL